MTAPTMTISISRSTEAGGPTDLDFSGAIDGTDLGIVSYQAPARIPIVTYAPHSGNIHGDESTGGSLAQAQLSFDWMCDTADDEADMQAAYEAVCAALSQFSYDVTTQISSAPAQVWAADMGAVTPPARTFIDLEHPDALVMTVTIPVHPIPGSA